MREGAQGWYTGMTLRDAMGRELEGDSGWGTHVHPWVIHVNVWQKPLDQVISQFVWKYKNTPNSQSNLEKEEWNWRNQLA